jgi:hypothetical protein
MDYELEESTDLRRNPFSNIDFAAQALDAHIRRVLSARLRITCCSRKLDAMKPTITGLTGSTGVPHMQHKILTDEPPIEGPVAFMIENPTGAALTSSKSSSYAAIISASSVYEADFDDIKRRRVLRISCTFAGTVPLYSLNLLAHQPPKNCS